MTNTETTAAVGWYYAPGDPINTQRYWDGRQWQGGPTPVPQMSMYPPPPAASDRQHNNGGRFVASILDTFAEFGIFVVFVIGLAILFETVLIDRAIQELLLIGVALVVGAINRIVLVGLTGQSLGKRAGKVRVVRVATGAAPGIGWAMARFAVTLGMYFFSAGLLNIADTVSILLTKDRQRLSDRMIGLRVEPAMKPVAAAGLVHYR